MKDLVIDAAVILSSALTSRLILFPEMCLYSFNISMGKRISCEVRGSIRHSFLRAIFLYYYITSSVGPEMSDGRVKDSFRCGP